MNNILNFQPALAFYLIRYFNSWEDILLILIKSKGLFSSWREPKIEHLFYSALWSTDLLKVSEVKIRLCSALNLTKHNTLSWLPLKVTLSSPKPHDRVREIAMKSLSAWSAQSLNEQSHFYCSVAYPRIMMPIIRKELQICNYWLYPCCILNTSCLPVFQRCRQSLRSSEVVLQYLKKKKEKEKKKEKKGWVFPTKGIL